MDENILGKEWSWEEEKGGISEKVLIGIWEENEIGEQV
jgi:hypothetical protein